MNPMLSIARPTPPATTARHDARRLYFALLGEDGAAPGEIDDVTRSTSAAYLRARLEEVDHQPLDDNQPPADCRALPAWLDAAHVRTAAAYGDYLAARRNGAPRRYFRDRSHALGFLRAVAPTKLVDGAWLYGLLAKADDQRLWPLVRTYLEELGDGCPGANHVALYRALLAVNDCDNWAANLDDDHYVQGAIQLALAHHADRFLPEIIGYNLGYEQLPLHLPITAHELDELGLDPHYFRLHVTIDNASTGHAKKAVRAAFDCLPRIDDRDAFYRRIIRGYRLNDLGVGTVEAIARFDLDRELATVLTDHARVGGALHPDRCRIAGRPVADWLSSPADIPGLLSALVTSGWIRRGQPPAESRFWRALHDERGPMYGVFDGYASQLLHDWILDGHEATDHARTRRRAPPRPALERTDATTTGSPRATTVEELVRTRLDPAVAASDDPDVHALAERMADVHDRATALATLRGFLSPANHPTPAGLIATQLFARLVGP